MLHTTDLPIPPRFHIVAGNLHDNGVTVFRVHVLAWVGPQGSRTRESDGGGLKLCELRSVGFPSRPAFRFDEGRVQEDGSPRLRTQLKYVKIEEGYAQTYIYYKRFTTRRIHATNLVAITKQLVNTTSYEWEPAKTSQVGHVFSPVLDAHIPSSNMEMRRSSPFSISN